MKALVKTAPGEGNLALQEVEKPVPGPNEVLIRISKTGICGTDLHIYLWDAWAARTIKTPMTIGHEFVGIIAEVGSHVTGYRVGQRVSAEGHVVCGYCRNCRAGRRHLCAHTVGIGVHRNGAFAEYVAVPAENVWPCPDDIPDDVAAIYDPLGNAAHTALSFDVRGEDVLIAGAGPIGLMAIPMVKMGGARHVVITDINPERLALAETMGATLALDVSKHDLKFAMDTLGMSEGFDVGLEMSGNPSAFRAMIQHMAHGGQIAMLGIQPESTGIDWDAVVFRGLTLKGIYGREMYETWYKLTAMLQSGLKVAPVITHRMKYSEFEEGFRLLRAGKAAKVVLDWTSI